MMNVASGGTLYGDIPTEIGTKVIHRNKGEVYHEIALCDTSTLIFPTIAVSKKSSDISSIIGPINLQGPHHSAQKSKRIGFSELKTSS